MVRTLPKSKDNPYEFEEIKKRIEERLKEYSDKFEVIQVPNITNICYGRGVGYEIEEIVLPEEIQKISATKIRQSEIRKRHSFAGTSVFEHLKPRENSIEDVATDWLEADLQTTQEKLVSDRAMAAEAAKRAKIEKDASFQRFGEDQAFQMKKFLKRDDEEEGRRIPTPEYAYRVLDSKDIWKEEKNSNRERRLTRQFEYQAHPIHSKSHSISVLPPPPYSVHGFCCGSVESLILCAAGLRIDPQQKRYDAGLDGNL